MSFVADLAQLDPTLKALGGVITALGVLWTAMGTRAWHRERQRQASGGDRYDSAGAANKRLFEFLEPRLKEMERRCDECERREAVTHRKFNAEMDLMRAQYLERFTAQAAEIEVLRKALRDAGLPLPATPIIAGSILDDLDG